MHAALPLPPHGATPVPPRDFTPGAGLPGDRRARQAAREAFAGLKLNCLQALHEVPGAEWLRAQVHAAEEPVDLWLLRAPMFSTLGGMDPGHRQRRQMLRRSLDSVFPDLDGPLNDFSPL